MCFSATASFTASALLLPVGVYCLHEARQAKKPYWLLAVMPLLFAIQQFLEGQRWLAVQAHQPASKWRCRFNKYTFAANRVCERQACRMQE
ncbi:DUF6629 family protein [Sulfuriflexus mobilis]|uniref:DUF6629 family protein n=1 Tax=Sulfuriflexus mobilis TaxID=1811807 RepID=UPI003B847EF3